MLLNEFLLTGKRAKRIQFPKSLDIFHERTETKGWQCYKEDGNYYIQILINDVRKTFSLKEFLDLVSPSKESVIKVHQAIKDYYANGRYKQDLPLYFVRRHNSPEKDNVSTRRRGWVVKFKNAYVVFIDNFFVRHFFEYSFYCSEVTKTDIEELISSHQMPFSSGGGEWEKLHRVFPSLSHLTACSKMYLSHIYDVSKDYKIGDKVIDTMEALGSRENGHFGHGSIEDWIYGSLIFGGKNCKVINETLDYETLAFLKISNIRALSPFNYFAFPKQGILKVGSIRGEDEGLRNKVVDYYLKKFGEVFVQFQKTAGVPYGYHKETSTRYVKERKVRDKNKKLKATQAKTTRPSNTAEFTKEEIIERVKGWKLKEHIKAHKIIARMVKEPNGISADLFISFLKNEVQVGSPKTTIASLTSNIKKQYGKVLHVKDNMVYLDPELRKDIIDIWKH